MLPRNRFRAFPVFALVPGSLATACPDATEVATQCAQSDFVRACPVGSNPAIGVAAESACGGEFSGNLVEESGSASGQCTSTGTCQVLCQFEVPCTCGVETISKQQIMCSECPAQSCGDSRCEGTERPSCAPAERGCQPCPEDCSGLRAGDGDCTGSENPQSCPQDCAQECVPNAQECIGNILRKCSADGRGSVAIDCADSGLICLASAAQCVPGGHAATTICDGDETPGSCPEDCAGAVRPESIALRGHDAGHLRRGRQDRGARRLPGE